MGLRVLSKRVMCRRVLAVAALVVTLVVVGAAPAFAHATLLSTEPTNSGVYDKPPSEVKLRFSEPVEVSLGGIRVYASDKERVVTGLPQHPDGSQREVAVSLPKIADGTYVVTWRVTSTDAHPIEGAYTFQVGPTATLSERSAQGVAARLLAATGGSTTVGVLYGIDRAALFGSLALLIGGAVFLVVVWPRGRDDRRAGRVVWGGWFGVLVTSVFGIALEGVYAAGLPLSKVFDPDVFRDVFDTRYGKVALVRLALLAVAYPLLRMLVGRRPSSEHPLRAWWLMTAAVVGAGLAVTPGLSGHAATGIQTGLAIPADLVHVAGMACWLGGLVMVLVAVLPRRDVDELREVLPRYSALALGAIVALIVSGGYQAWRQVGSLDALKNTDYGRLLIVKLVVFASLIIAAAFSREIVNRRFRDFGPDDDEYDEVLVPVTVGGGEAGSVAVGGRYDEPWDDDTTDAEELRRLRRSVGIEVVIAVVILAVTALLVNAAPARSDTTEPVGLTLKSSQVWVYVDIAPGSAGPNDMHFTALPTGGGPASVQDMEVQLTRPGEDLPPFTVPLQKLGTGHYYSPLYDIPYPGKWQMTIRVQLSATDEAVLVGPFIVR